MALPFNPYGNLNPYTQAGLVYPQVQPTANQSNVIWVQGESAAKAYPVQAGNSMILLDSENDCFYIKSSDNAGMPNKLRKFEYKEVVEGQVIAEPIEQTDYVTKEEFDRVVSELRQQRQHYNNNRKGDRNEQTV